VRPFAALMLPGQYVLTEDHYWLHSCDSNKLKLSSAQLIEFDSIRGNLPRLAQATVTVVQRTRPSKKSSSFKETKLGK